MNCKPNQLAYVRIPEGAMREAVRAQINGMPVITTRLKPGEIPLWEISPSLSVVIRHRHRDIYGTVMEPGKVSVCGLPDEYLVPIRGAARPETVTTGKELEAQ